MAKRGPQSVLNHDNWDNEEESEDAGIFKQAPKSTLEQRVIKKAKRRGGDDGGTGAFGGFGGFGGLGSKPALNQNAAAKTTNSTSFKLTTATATADPVFKPKPFSGGAAATSPFDNAEKSSSTKSESKDNSTYLNGLKSLNESVLAWIKQHVDKNPYIILTPIFKDYEKYLATLESKKSSSTTTITTTTNGSGSTESSKAAPLGTSSSETTKSVFASPLSKQQPEDSKDESKKEEEKEKSPTKAPAAAFTFGSTSSNGEGFKFSSSATPTTGFTFGKTSSTTTAPPSSTFTFGQTSSSSLTSATSGFSFGTTSTSVAPKAPTAFGGAAGFSFGTLAANSMAAQATGSDNKGQEDDEYVPPKPEVKEVKEDGSVYSKRCKLFYQKDGKWAERGVGNVHIKPSEETKTQILVRADTNLGNILLNIMLTSGLPISRQGKNNLLLVCVPNPPIKEGQDGDQKPISMLIRVKTAEEADELLTTLEERKALL